MMIDKFTLTCIETCTRRDPSENVDILSRAIQQAADNGAEFIASPETCNFMEKGREAMLSRLCQEADDPVVQALQAAAKTHGVYVLAGSVAVVSADGRAANRSIVFAPDGNIIARYDKIHLFDVTLANGEHHAESNNYQAGEQAVTADLPWGKLGMSICYDLRFASLYRSLALAGACFISVPSAFTRPTGKAHWRVLLRARAIETGCYIFAPAQSGSHENGRETYGHTMIVSPWGEVLAQSTQDSFAVGGEDKDDFEVDGYRLVSAELDVKKVVAARQQIPSLRHGRDFTPPHEAGSIPSRG